KGPARAQNRRSEARMPLMEVYQTGVSTTAEADLHALHDSLPQSVTKSTQQLALQIRQLGRPSGLGDTDDEHPPREAQGAGVGRQLRSDEVGPVPEHVTQRGCVGTAEAAGDLVERRLDRPRVGRVVLAHQAASSRPWRTRSTRSGGAPGG